jgi:hypothetical protein
MSHDTGHGHSKEVKSIISFKNSFWLVVIILGVFVAALNFIQAEGKGEEGKKVEGKETMEMKSSESKGAKQAEAAKGETPIAEDPSKGTK